MQNDAPPGFGPGRRVVGSPGRQAGGNCMVSGTFANATAGSYDRVRVDVYNHDSNPVVALAWTRPGGQLENVPGQYLHPRYGLATSTTTSESGPVPSQTTSTSYSGNGLDPVYGLATGGSVDPTGLNLAGSAGYETPGSGYLRQTSKTMPTGAQTTYAYYGDTETRANPCVAGSPVINQAGLAKISTSPAPAAGPARTDEQVFDASGRIVAKAISGDWNCTTYDSRDWVTEVHYPSTTSAPARTVDFNYAVNGDPLTTSVTDAAGTVTTVTDLLGHVLSYTDVQGTVTTTSYDQAGRVTSTTTTPPNAADPAHTLSYTY